MDSKNSLISGSWLVDNHIDYPDTLFDNLLALDYDKSMRARWTASFGKLSGERESTAFAGVFERNGRSKVRIQPSFSIGIGVETWAVVCS